MERGQKQGVRARLVAVLLAIGCVTGGGLVACDRAQDSSDREARIEAPQASPPAGGNIAALRACAEVGEGVREIPRGERAGMLLAACGEVFANRQCQDAWTAAREARLDERVGILVRGCAKAYCPSLHDEPALCKVDLTSSDDDVLRALWRPFVFATLEREVGLEAVERYGTTIATIPFALSIIEVSPPVVEPASTARPVLPLRVAMWMGPSAARVELDGRTWRLREGDLGDMTELEVAIDREWGTTEVVLDVGPGVPYALIRALMATFVRVGLEDVVMVGHAPGLE